MAKYQLVLQWPASSIEDYDALIAFEGELIRELSDKPASSNHPLQ